MVAVAPGARKSTLESDACGCCFVITNASELHALIDHVTPLRNASVKEQIESREENAPREASNNGEDALCQQPSNAVTGQKRHPDAPNGCRGPTSSGGEG